jgi:AcrR family transcriptional regulator
VEQKTGLRERKKAQARRHIAETAARLFAARGYDDVSMADVAAAAEVSDQTVYNYFPAKQDLVLDRSDELRELYTRTVRERAAQLSPAGALRVIAREDVERYRTADRELARGEFPALAVSSASIRRFALEARDQQADAIAAAIAETSPAVHPDVARVHAAALVATFQLIVDRIGRGVLAGADAQAVADDLARSVEVVLDDLDAHFRVLSGGPHGSPVDR